MFRTKLQIFLALIALIALLQGAVGLWGLELAGTKVIRGRVASDIHNQFITLSDQKQTLKAWLSRALLMGHTRTLEYREEHTEERRRLTEAMMASLDRIDALALQAKQLDGDRATAARDLEMRQEIVRLLRRSLEELILRLDSLSDSAWAQHPSSLIFDLDQTFDRRDGRDLRSLLRGSIAREESILARQREEADRSLRHVRWLVVGATFSLSLLAFGLAVHFSRALRRPLDSLITGADALKQGRLDHRIPDDRGDEFGIIARRMNAMAEELMLKRRDETTARRELEALVRERTGDLQQALGALQQIDARRRQLFADVSHELRTPTTAIRGEAEITLRGRDKQVDEYKTALRNIADSARQLGVVIDDLLILARTDVDSIALARSPVDAREVLRAALAEARTLGQERGLRWQVVEVPGPLPMQADARRLRQLLMVVLDNAVRYSRDGQTIEVRTELGVDGELSRWWKFVVSDQGIGIAPEDLALVFQRNFRGAHARAHAPNGSGLGLPLADVLCRAHGGRIAIESVLGQGTTVTVTLPLKLPDEGPAADPLALEP